MAILDNAHPIMGVVVLNLVGVVEKWAWVQNFHARSARKQSSTSIIES
jgi:hypothetical protein